VSVQQHSGIILLNDCDNPLTGLRVLVVEDGKINQIVARRMLEDSGAIVEIAENGKIGFERIQSAPTDFDVVLMDMQMPVMDGYEATFRLRQMGYKKPIIAVTAHALTGDCEKTLLVGCNAYISKPMDRNKLIDTILRFDQETFALQ
jgi:CheY-like chemotaxis protein